MGARFWLVAAALNRDGFHSRLAGMNSKPSYPLGPRLLLAAMFLGTLAFSAGANAQSEPAKPDFGKAMTLLPLDESASRGIVTRDPSDIVQRKDEYGVFYTGGACLRIIPGTW